MIFNVKKITAGMDKSKNVYARLFQDIKSLFAIKKQHRMTDHDYKRFGGNIKTLDMYEVKILDHKLIQ